MTQAVSHRVVAEVQPYGDVLVMFEDGTVKRYVDGNAVVDALRKRDRREAAKLTNSVVLTEIEWR